MLKIDVADANAAADFWQRRFQYLYGRKLTPPSNKMQDVYSMVTNHLLSHSHKDSGNFPPQRSLHRKQLCMCACVRVAGGRVFQVPTLRSSSSSLQETAGVWDKLSS